jgi:putative ABC transport system permease protein
MARKVFGDEPALGRTFTVDNDQTFRVTGVIADPPRQTHLSFEVLLSWATFHSDRDLTRWLGGHVFTYVLLAEGLGTEALLAKWPAFFEEHMKSTFDRLGATCKLMIQPLTDIHLRSWLQWEVSENGNIVYVYVFAAIGIFILGIACVNYMNLATARSARRAEEIGLRKVFGAQRNLIARQFLNESSVFAALSLLLGILVALVALPYFNGFVGKQLSLNLLANPMLALGLLALTVFVSLFSGSYPALYLSSILPVSALRASQNSGATRSILRRVLVVSQFAISIIIIAGTGVVQDQLEFARQKDLGFNKEHICIITMRESIDIAQIPTIKTELLRHPNILKAAVSHDVPGTALNHTTMEIETAAGSWQQQFFHFMQIDHDFLDLMEIELLAGRNLDLSRTTDVNESVLINEAAVVKFGLENPIGKRVRWSPDEPLTVVGIVNDIHTESFRSEIAPVVLFLPQDAGGKLYLRLRGENIKETVAFLEEKWQAYDPEFPLDYVFLDEHFYKVHESDERLATMFLGFSIIAVVISCLGLLGLASFSTAQRTKEIGIRKVLGASVGNVVFMIWQEFIKLVVLATLVAWPVAYIAMSRWLDAFAYRVALRAETFLLAGGIALAIALCTISMQSIRAATANPVRTLRYE